MRKIPKPRMRKSKPGKIHEGRPLVMHGWKNPIRWVIRAWRRPGNSIRKVSKAFGWEGLLEARETAKGMILDGWEGTEIKELEMLTPKAKDK